MTPRSRRSSRPATRRVSLVTELCSRRTAASARGCSSGRCSQPSAKRRSCTAGCPLRSPAERRRDQWRVLALRFATTSPRWTCSWPRAPCTPRTHFASTPVSPRASWRRGARPQRSRSAARPRAWKPWQRSAVFRDDAVYWYRGTAACSAAIELARLDRALDGLGVDRVVIGHTPTRDDRVQSRFDSAVIRADTGMLATYFRGQASAVVIRGADVRALYAGSAEETAARTAAARRRPACAVSATTRSRRCSTQGRIVTTVARCERRGAGASRCAMASSSTPCSARRRSRLGVTELPEVAAYRLDRLLELEFVPVAVRRRSTGASARCSSTSVICRTKRNARATRNPSNAWCPLRDQLNAMYVFDVLAFNEGRQAASMRYLPEGGQLVLTDNGRPVRDSRA